MISLKKISFGIKQQSLTHSLKSKMIEFLLNQDFVLVYVLNQMFINMTED